MASAPAPPVPDEAPNNLRLYASQRLLRWSIETAQSWSGVKRKTSADLLIFSMLARSTRTYEAIVRRLGESGMGEQGLMLNRSLFEDMVDIHWVHLNPDLAMERLDLHDRFSLLLRTQVARTYPEMHDQPPAPPKISNHDRQEMRKLFGAYGQKSWTGVDRLDKRLDAILNCWPTDADRRQVSGGTRGCTSSRTRRCIQAHGRSVVWCRRSPCAAASRWSGASVRRPNGLRRACTAPCGRTRR